MEKPTKEDKKRLFLLTFEKKFTVTEVCDLLQIHRTLPYKWAARDIEFKEKFEDVQTQKKNEIKDAAKKSLLQQIKEGDSRLPESHS